MVSVPNIAYKLNAPVEDVVLRIVQTDGPSLNNATVPTETRFYDDKTTYTGVHTAGGPTLKGIEISPWHFCYILQMIVDICIWRIYSTAVQQMCVVYQLKYRPITIRDTALARHIPTQNTVYPLEAEPPLLERKTNLVVSSTVSPTKNLSLEYVKHLKYESIHL